MNQRLFFSKDPGARFERAAENFMSHLKSKQCTAHLTVSVTCKSQHECMTVKAKGRRVASSYQTELSIYILTEEGSRVKSW